ncbi:hypothetical protein Tco_0833761 [Tanacetum coccineum]
MPDSVFPLNLFDTPHHISITADADRFTNNVPNFHWYDSRHPDDWVVDAALPWDNLGQNAPDLGNCITMVHNHSLYTMGFRIDDVHIPFYTVCGVMSIDQPTDHNESSWYYFGAWALLLRSSRSRTKLFRLAIDINLYQRTSFTNGTYLHVCPLPDLQYFRVPLVLDDYLTAKVFDGILYI